jgi:hypothetical protein
MEEKLTVRLEPAEVRQAVREWLGRRGYEVTDTARFLDTTLQGLQDSNPIALVGVRRTAPRTEPIDRGLTFSDYVIGERSRKFYDLSLQDAIKAGSTLEAHLPDMYYEWNVIAQCRGREEKA